MGIALVRVKERYKVGGVKNNIAIIIIIIIIITIMDNNSNG